MDSRAADILQVRALLTTTLATVDRLVEGDTLGMRPDELDGVTFAAVMVRRYHQRSREHAAAWRAKVMAGEDGWLLLRSVPGDFRIDAWHHDTLPRNIQRALTKDDDPK